MPDAAMSLDGKVAVIGGALEHLTRGFAVDLAPVRINAVCSGLIRTDHIRQMPAERLRAYLARLPLPRAGPPRLGPDGGPA